MKKETFAIITISGALLIVPARNFGQASSNDNSESTKDKIEKTATATKDYTDTKKNEFISSMKVHLKKLDNSLDVLGDKIQRSGSKTKAKAEPEYDALRERVAQFGKQLDHAKSATHSTWETVKKDSQKSYQNLKGEIQREREKMNEDL